MTQENRAASEPVLVVTDSDRTKPAGLPLEFLKQNVPCQWACPAMTDIPAYILAAYHGDFDESHRVNARDNLFAGILGRICTRPCENACRHGLEGLGEPVAICHLKRAAADFTDTNKVEPVRLTSETGKSVGIVGAGPAGIAAAHWLWKLGHDVVVYEAQDKAGGMITRAIPAFRLPLSVADSEIDSILHAGIERQFGNRFGENLQLEQLQQNHDAVILAFGCQSSKELNIDGLKLPGVHYGLKFLLRCNQGERTDIGKRVLVIGGGFTAIDCARMARRLGATSVQMVLRREIVDMPVRQDDIEETRLEKVDILERLQPQRIEAGSSGLLLHCRQTDIVTVDGRRTAQSNDNVVELQADSVLIAIGQRAEPGLLKKLPAFDRDGRSELPWLFATGDLATGPANVIQAVGHGRRVAEEVDAFLMGERRLQRQLLRKTASNTHREQDWDEIPRVAMPMMDDRQRYGDIAREVETGYAKADVEVETKRCYLCNLLFEIEVKDCVFCERCVDLCPTHCIEMSHMPFDQNLNNEEAQGGGFWSRLAFWKKKWEDIKIFSESCIRCGLCVNVCPTQCIHVDRVQLQDVIRNSTERNSVL